MADTVLECGNPKCPETIATSGMNKVQLEALRRWAKTCPKCHQRTKWQEKLPLLNTETLKVIGGSKNAATNKTVSKTQSQKRKAARYSGH